MTEKQPPIVLIVDDDEGIRDTLEAILKGSYRVIKAADGETALCLVNERDVRVVLLDIRLPGIDGLEVLKQVKERYDDVEVIMITAVREVETAVAAMKLGAYDYITKEFDYDEVVNLVHRVVEKQTLTRELIYLKTEIDQYIKDDFLIGRSPKMKAIYDVIQKVARLPATVLITGESGTGKELVARLVHREGGQPERPFIVVNLASIPSELVESALFGHEKGAFTGAYRQHYGKFELAHGGTLFLDEIGDMRLDLQAKLLRAIQEGEIERVGGTKAIVINTRLIAATNKNLEQAVRRGEFREDLYYRLNVIPIRLPPLRERRQDIPDFVQFFLERYNRKFKKKIGKITDPALKILCEHDWPGNVRELEHLIERLVATVDGPTLFEGHIPIEYYFRGSDYQPFPETEGSPPLKSSPSLREACETFERNFILKVLEKAHWNRARAADRLGLPLSTLKYKLTRLGLYEFLSEQEPPQKKGLGVRG